MVSTHASGGLRRHSRRIMIAIAATAALTALVIACSSDKQPTQPTRTIEQCIAAIAPPIPGTTQQVIAMRNFAFVEDSVRITAGTTVTWANCEPANIDSHTATAKDGTWHSGFLAPGAKYSRVFSEVGRFEYFCEPHPFMHGVIIVE
ncbi:MAG: plastocyanin/azurin family copper-binding protein [Gemmatimonadaceae bacterium]